MDIDKFVEQTLRSIRKGAAEAANEPGLEINPKPYMSQKDNTAGGHIIAMKTGSPILFIKFNLSVIVQAGQTEESGGQIKVLGVGGDTKLISKLDQTQIQHISFDIPITFFRPEDKFGA